MQDAPAAIAASQAGYLGWLLALGPGPAGDVDRVARLLAAADAVLDGRLAGERLLRRAPNVVPRLVQALRDDGWDRREVAAQVQRDPVLAAETLRLARSALYARRGVEAGVPQAVDLLGAAGLKQVVARVLVRPLFQLEGDSLAARAAPRLWDASERTARLCVALAREQGVDGVDACLAGLLQHLGWSALLQLLAARGAALAPHQGCLAVPGLPQALALRRDRLLAQLLPAWRLSPGVDDWGRALADEDQAAAHPLGRVVVQAQALAVARWAAAEAGQPPDVPPGLPAGVAAVWAED